MHTPINLVAEQYDGINVSVRLSRPVNPTSLSDRRASTSLQALPQCTYVSGRDVFVFPITAHSVDFIQDKYPDIIWEDESAKQAFDLVRSLEKGVARRADIMSRYIKAVKMKNENGTELPPDAVPTMIDHTFKRNPMAHQLVGFECGRRAPFLGLFFEMGTGKTKVISDLVDYAAQTRKKKNPLRVLIVCPKSVLVNWVRELSMDVSVPYRVSVLSRIGSTMRQELREKNLVCGRGGQFGAIEGLLELIRCKDVALQLAIINYDTVPARLDLLKKMQFDVAVLDESHRIKSMNRKRTKAILDLAFTCSRRFCLTGTPLTQNPMDLFSQFEFLGPGMALLGYSNYNAYGTAYAKRNRWGRVEGFNDTGKLLTLASKWALSVKKKDCLDLPDKMFEQREIEMSAEQQEMYKQVATEVLLVLESLGTEVTIQNILVQYLRLAQVTSGYIKTADGREVPIHNGQGKIDELIDILRDTDEQVVVWSRFVYEIESICKRLEKEGIEHVAYYGSVNADKRQEAVDRFQKRQAKVFVGNAAAGGIGINLTAGSIVVYVSNSFSLADRLQSEDRTHRIGQKNPCTYIDLTCMDTIDELTLKRLQNKREMAEFFTNPTEMVASLRDFLTTSVAGN